MNARKQAALELVDRGEPVTVCPIEGLRFKAEKDRGKVPLGDGWDRGVKGGWGEAWQHKQWTSDDIERAFRIHPAANVGLQLGPRSRKIDLETDGPDEESDLAKLFADCNAISCPTFKSTRGKHRLYGWNDRLAETKKAVVYFGKLGCRIGADSRGAHSIIPPSVAGGVRREWLLSFDDVDPPELPAVVVERLLEAAKPPKQRGTVGGEASGDVAAAIAVMLRMKAGDDESDGSKRLFASCCRCVEFDLTDGDAIEAIRQYATQRPFPREWTDVEITQRLRDAERRIDRGSAIVLSNGREVKTSGGKGKSKSIVVARSLPEVLGDIRQRTGDWPRRVGSTLFVDDHEIGWLEKQAGLFGYLRSRCKVRWHSGPEFPAQGEVFEELRRTATKYEAVEPFPHEPPIAGHYYACLDFPAGDGRHLAELLNRFTPATDIDRDLIQAAFLTPGWGGLPGCRPCFIVTSDDGRGAGKTTLVAMIGAVWGGVLDFAKNEDSSRIRTRLLSPESLIRRVALLDNIKTLRFSWPELESLVTAPVIGGHRMYCGEGTRPNVLTWFVTLNGASLSTDMAQRSVIIKLRRPQRSATWAEDTREFIDRNRAAIVGDVLATLRGEPFPLAKFTRWASWERDVLQRLPEPGEAQKTILERQAEADVEEEDAEIVTEYMREQLFKLGYNPRTDQIHIPAGIACEWFNRATNERQKVGGVSRILRQAIDEGRMTRLAVNRCNAWGKGFVWIGEESNPEHQVQTDIRKRLDEAKGEDP